MSNITSLKTAEELFQVNETGTGTGDINNAIRTIDNLEKRAENGEDDGFLSDDDDWNRFNGDDDDEQANFEEQDQFDDESGDDYDAEQYFDDGDKGDDYDEGGDDGGGDYL